MSKRSRQEIVKDLLADQSKLLSKRPFTRGGRAGSENSSDGQSIYMGQKRMVQLPRVHKYIVSQDTFARELDPNCHKVIYDKNLPSICVKVQDGGYQDIEFKRVGMGFQESIRQKKTLSLCGNPRELTLHNANPSEAEMRHYADLKWKWKSRNMDGLSTRSVYGQHGYGDVGLLMFMDDNDEIRGRVLSYEDGYVIVSHNDDDGRRVLECVYYEDEDGNAHADCYDDTYLYRLYGDETADAETGEGGWGVKEVIKHGFSEIPLVTKRGPVAWNNVEDLIEAMEILWNLFIVIQKRHGWGILYIRGNFNESVKRLAGSIILQDTTIDGNGTAEFKTPPSPDNMIATLDALMEQLQRDASVTFILPKDISTGGDISGLAVQMTRALDIEWATSAAIEWQNFADKHMRLFKEGLAMEMVRKGENPTAVTDFRNMRVSCRFKMWQPFDETSYNQMICTAKQAGIISQQTAVERNTLATPDEYLRVLNEARAEEEKAAASAEDAIDVTTTGNAQ